MQSTFFSLLPLFFSFLNINTALAGRLNVRTPTANAPNASTGIPTPTSFSPGKCTVKAMVAGWFDTDPLFAGTLSIIDNSGTEIGQQMTFPGKTNINLDSRLPWVLVGTVNSGVKKTPYLVDDETLPAGASVEFKYSDWNVMANTTNHGMCQMFPDPAKADPKTAINSFWVSLSCSFHCPLKKDES